MKSFVNFCVVIVMNITIVHATLDGTKVKNSVMLNSNFSSQSTSNNQSNSEQILHCNGNNDNLNVSPHIALLATRIQILGKALACNEVKYLSYGRFSPDGCNNAITCRKSFRDASSSSTEKILNEVVAKDFAANMLKFKTELMDKIELLKRFADLKYNIKSDKCKPRYELPAKSDTCNLSLLDEVFVSDQQKCQNGESCFNNSNLNYSTFKYYKDQNKLYNNAYIVDYNEYRMTQLSTKLKEEDEALLDDLANLSTSENFNSLTPTQKTDLFLKKLESQSGDKYKDPFFALDLGRVSEKDKFKKSSSYQLIVKMFEQPFPNKEIFKSNYEDLRQSRAKHILNTSDFCSNQIDLNKICEEVTKISKGEINFKNPFEAELLSTKGLSKEKEYEKMLSLLGKDFNRERYELLINAKRCIAFKLGSEEKASSINQISETWYNNQNESEGPNNRIVTKTRTQSQSITTMNEVPKKESIGPRLSDPKVTEENKNINSSFSNTPAVVSNPVGQFGQGFTPSHYGLENDVKNESVEKKVDTLQVQNPVNVTSNNSNMNELMRRLTAAEDKVDKMKAASDEAESESIKQKKIAEENALIKELRGQIADLKDTKSKKDAEKDSAIVNSIIEQPRPQINNFPSTASLFNNAIISAPARQDSAPKVVENFDTGRSSNSAPGPSAPSSKGVSGPILTSTTTNNDSNKAIPAGATFTTIDGMSSEIANQTISKKIIELNGSPFYIEEAGVIIEIIAVVKDGKILLDEKGNPVYEKIIKGKVDDKALAKTKDQKRAPAAITNTADLKRDQEEKLKRERAEYLKLKNLTNGIINNKQ